MPCGSACGSRWSQLIAIRREAEAVPNDPSYSEQWALPQIGWDDAYGTIAPSGSATIAVLDTGVDAVDDLSLVDGYSAIGGDTADANGHGTWVASIAAANVDNGLGIAGVGYAGVSVMPVKVLSADGTGQDSDIIAGIVWAADHDADVILMAFSNPGYSQALQDAIDYASVDAAPIPVAATGNDGLAAAEYPAGDAKVVGVAATDPSRRVVVGFQLWKRSVHRCTRRRHRRRRTGRHNQCHRTRAAAAIVAGAAALVEGQRSRCGERRHRRAPGPQHRPRRRRQRSPQSRPRALADTASEGVTPEGVPGGGGPIVGPYVISAAMINGATLNGAACERRSRRHDRRGSLRRRARAAGRITERARSAGASRQVRREQSRASTSRT